MTTGTVNIIIIIGLVILSIALVKGHECFKRTLRFHKVKKIMESRKICDMFDDLNIKPRTKSHTVKETIDGMENVGKALKNWNSFSGYKSEQEQINETLDRR